MSVLREKCLGKGNVGAFCGLIVPATQGTVSFENCYARVDIYSDGYDAAGFGVAQISSSYEGKKWVSAKNCYWSGENNATIRSGTLLQQGLGNNANQVVSSSIVLQNCYYNKELYKLSVANSGTGLTTAQMKTQSSYAGWDFENTWYMGEDGYPELKFD